MREYINEMKERVSWVADKMPRSLELREINDNVRNFVIKDAKATLSDYVEGVGKEAHKAFLIYEEVFVAEIKADRKKFERTAKKYFNDIEKTKNELNTLALNTNTLIDCLDSKEKRTSPFTCAREINRFNSQLQKTKEGFLKKIKQLSKFNKKVFYYVATQNCMFSDLYTSPHGTASGKELDAISDLAHKSIKISESLKYLQNEELDATQEFADIKNFKEKEASFKLKFPNLVEEGGLQL